MIYEGCKLEQQSRDLLVTISWLTMSNLQGPHSLHSVCLLLNFLSINEGVNVGMKKGLDLGALDVTFLAQRSHLIVSRGLAKITQSCITCSQPLNGLMVFWRW